MYLGILASMLARWDAAERHYADALEMNDRWGVRPAAAWTRYYWAEMLIRRADARDRDRSRSLLMAAKAAADEMGMTRLAGDAAALADHPELSRRTHPDRAIGLGLSQREMDVLRLIVSGQTDKEIGGALSISPRTVSTHVTSILNKLGASTRTEAAMMAVRAGVLTPPE
jgi:DNA-binding CsgD family transcriptional regulator